MVKASKIPLFEQKGIQTATIKGKVETDLKKTVAETPENLTVCANLDGNGLEGSYSENSENSSGFNSSIYVEGLFSFAQGDIGAAPAHFWL